MNCVSQYRCFKSIELLEDAENLFGEVLPQFKILPLSTVYFEKNANILVGTWNGTDVRNLIEIVL